MLPQFVYFNGQFLACISQIVDRGSFSWHIPNASRSITIPFDRGRLFPIPYAQTSLIHDRHFRSTRPGYFAVTFRIPKRSVNITIDNFVHLPLCFIDRGDLYRTCTPNVIHNNDRLAFHWHCIHGLLSVHNSNPGTNLPTDRGSFIDDTFYCIPSPCMPRHATPISTPSATVTRIAIPSLFQSHQYNTRPVLFRVHSAVLKRCW